MPRLLAFSAAMWIAATASAVQFTRSDHPTDGRFSTGIALADYDGDGQVDIATANYLSGDLSILTNLGGGGFSAGVLLEAGGPFGPWWVSAGDLDGDGAPDLVAAQLGDAELLVFLNDGTGSFGPPVAYPVVDSPEYAGLFDLDGDGDLDVVSPNDSAVANVFLNDGTGALTALPIVDLPFEEGHVVAFSDFDRDGAVDFVISHSTQPVAGPPFPPCEERRPGVTVAYGDGTGLFPRVQAWGTDLGYHAAVGDFDEDGWDDIATADLCGPELRVLLNDGAGEFPGPATITEVGRTHNDLISTDMDCDGHLDLFVADSDADEPKLHLMLGDGTGAFAPDPDGPYAEARAPSAVRVAELDGDGRPDAATVGTGDPQVAAVFLNVTPDLAPPEVSCEVAVSCLWPPNHRLVDVGLAVTAIDAGCGAPIGEFTVSAVLSDEATNSELGAGGKGRSTGPLPHAPDAAWTEDGRLLLRAERSGLGDGRVYRILVEAADAAGNVGVAECEVRVPHDQSPKTPGQVPGNDPDGPCPAIDSGGRFDAFAIN